MKYGITYSVFDGEEWLEHSLSCVRPLVDYISIVYQNTSNWGIENDNPDIIKFLKSLKTNKLADDVFMFTPNLQLQPNQNELQKRNFGVSTCKDVNCDYFMLMDCDELYIQSEFKTMLEYCEKYQPDSTFAKMYTYYKQTDTILDPIEDYGVPLMCKLYKDSNLYFYNETPISVDPTRKPNHNKNYKIFNEEEIMMHHMSYIRNNIRKKLTNSSARVNFNQFIDDIVQWYDDWKPGMQALVGGLPPTKYNTKTITQNFNVYI